MILKEDDSGSDDNDDDGDGVGGVVYMCMCIHVCGTSVRELMKYEFLFLFIISPYSLGIASQCGFFQLSLQEKLSPPFSS